MAKPLQIEATPCFPKSQSSVFGRRSSSSQHCDAAHDAPRRQTDRSRSETRHEGFPFQSASFEQAAHFQLTIG
ncbi:hypothetical protein AAHA92_06293 [Salvia divinorum]|uniref:Uncharacterized protein n=1 Tax=Salvia divinorum TaxID=28513 RepID=A0ABD1I8B2_SALDI